ncbi:hypothetical protein [Methylobacterium sp.]|uniref:hypothetical protein n=1 Tax=Methylobacterium sp. TaxID=409 RepID=UPI003C75BA54
MTLKSPRLSFSHAGQDFVVKARPTEEGIEARGFWNARSKARTRFFVLVITETGQTSQANQVQAALRLVRDQIIAAIDVGEPLVDETQP